MVVLIGDHDGLKKLYVDPLKQVREGLASDIEIKDANHITCVAKPQFARRDPGDGSQSRRGSEEMESAIGQKPTTAAQHE